MATLRNKRKLAAVTTETQEEHPRNGQSPNAFVRRINEEYITQVSEEIEGRVSIKMSQLFSRTESCILCALSKLDVVPLRSFSFRTDTDALRNPSGNIPEHKRGKPGTK